jgi:hypothetical protein
LKKNLTVTTKKKKKKKKKKKDERIKMEILPFSSLICVCSELSSVSNVFILFLVLTRAAKLREYPFLRTWLGRAAHVIPRGCVIIICATLESRKDNGPGFRSKCTCTEKVEVRISMSFFVFCEYYFAFGNLGDDLISTWELLLLLCLSNFLQLFLLFKAFTCFLLLKVIMHSHLLP